MFTAQLPLDVQGINYKNFPHIVISFGHVTKIKLK